MKGIMFNEHYGLESAVLNGSKIRTCRDELSLYKKHTEENWQFIHLLYDCYVELSFDGVNTFTANCNDGKLYDFKTNYSVGETLAIKQSYKDAGFLPSEYCYKYIESVDGYKKERYDEQKGWNNKMFVANNLMPHQIQITDIRLERMQYISDKDCMREGIIKKSIGCYVKGIRSTKENESYTIREDGVAYRLYPNFRQAYESLIDKVSGKGTWDKNPWVVVYYFKLIK